MARINLLPWREERRAEQQKQLLTITGLSVFLMLLIIVALHLEIGRQIGEQQRRNTYIQGEITKVDSQIKEIQNLEKEKKRLLSRMDVIQQLQQNRPEIVHLFDELPNILPEGMYLKSVRQQGRNLTIEGVAQSNARVSAFMRNIEASKWLADPVLDVIKTGKKELPVGAREFVLRAKQTSPEKEGKAK